MSFLNSLTRLFFGLFICVFLFLSSCGIKRSQYEVSDVKLDGSKYGNKPIVSENEFETVRQLGSLAIEKLTLEYLENVFVRNKNSTTVLKVVGERLLEKKEYLKAERVFKSISDFEEYPQVLAYLALIFANTNRNELAMDYMNRCIYLDPENKDITSQKAKVYLALKDSLSALKYYELSFEEDSLDMRSIKELVYLYLHKGDLDRAVELYDRLDKQYLSKDYFYSLGSKIIGTKENSLGVRLLEDGLVNGDVRSGMKLIKHYKGLNNLDSVYFYSDMLLQVDSMNLYGLCSKADYFNDKGYFSSSVQYYEKVLSIDSLNEEARLGLSKVYGKIAYLRKIKEQKESLQLLEVPSLDVREISN
ncbi:tetratricopeptide repeat protein [Reichenbachiella versicolor]|uniref:tetratricopeptide repeat protein n=1 Tax=Reichenbachiella versicolor TaxID=1821036 RepID=UPI000D6DC952|nr:hypothetical protein [Reichenbachiella versicolor]